MLAPLINFILILVAIAVLWKASTIGLKAIIYAILMSHAIAQIAPKAYVAAKAERSLPMRDLAFDCVGNRADAKAFNAIVQDRLKRTAVMAEEPEMAAIAVEFGRRLAQ